MLDAYRERQEPNAEAICGAFGGACRLIDCDTAVNDHTLDPLANVNMPDDSVGSRAKNHASMIFQITPRAECRVT